MRRRIWISFGLGIVTLLFVLGWTQKTTQSQNGRSSVSAAVWSTLQQPSSANNELIANDTDNLCTEMQDANLELYRADTALVDYINKGPADEKTQKAQATTAHASVDNALGDLYQAAQNTYKNAAGGNGHCGLTSSIGASPAAGSHDPPPTLSESLPILTSAKTHVQNAINFLNAQNSDSVCRTALQQAVTDSNNAATQLAALLHPAIKGSAPPAGSTGKPTTPPKPTPTPKKP